MKCKLLIGLLLLFAISSTAYAANNQIVSIIVNGKQVNGSGQIIDGSTMLPIRAVAEALGADIQWDGAKKQATVTMAPAAPVGLTLAELNKIGESVGLVTVYKSGTLLARGSAFVIDGYAITNLHVASGDSLKIDFGTKTFDFQIKDAAYKDESTDLIGFKTDGIKSLKINASLPKYKDHVYAIGYPRGRYTLSEGEMLLIYDDGFTHSAPTDAGSSGGVLLNGIGEIIGVTSSGNDNMELNVAIPSKHVQELIK